MRTLLLILLPVIGLAQVNRDILFLQRYRSATALNGTSQYWTRSSPSNLDLNGPEMITNANNTGFETNLGDWANFGNHSALRSTVDKRTGTASMRITSSGAGDTTANFMYLPPSALGTMVAGNKYTVELWARSGTATSTITLNVGTQSATSGTLSTTFGTFTKVVFNFTALTSTDTLKIYANKAIDSLYVDDVSLTQAYDAIYNLSASQMLFANQGSSLNALIARGTLGATNNGMLNIALNSSSKIVSAIDINTTTVTSTSTIGLGNYLISLVLNRTGNASLYINGTLEASVSIASIGMLNNTGALYFGRDDQTTRYLKFLLSNTQFARYTALPSDGGASIIADAYNRFRTKRPFANSYPNGQVVAWYDWSSGGTDKSGSGNHLTPVASPIIIKVK